ncbi:MAG: FimV/HubP family polar landmark protein, partial [Quisquiliibacterium sp.]
TTQSQSKGAQAASDAGFADLGIELPSLGDQPDHQLPAAETTESSSLDFDFSSINLELEPQSSQPAEGEQSEPSASASPEEIATKLELAVAYQEIGDSDGARELVLVVLQVGDACHKARAQDRLGKLW